MTIDHQALRPGDRIVLEATVSSSLEHGVHAGFGNGAIVYVPSEAIVGIAARQLAVGDRVQSCGYSATVLMIEGHEAVVRYDRESTLAIVATADLIRCMEDE